MTASGQSDLPAGNPAGFGHYFDHDPDAASDRRIIELALPDMFLNLHTDAGVFSANRVDSGSKYLLQEMPPPPDSALNILDLGCGYGPIALAVAKRAPETQVWAVDVNHRALALTTENASLNEIMNVRAIRPDEVPSDLQIDLIVSNPPIRIGKSALHQLLTNWLNRLSPHGRAWMVVHKHLGSDSLADWLRNEGFETTKLSSRKGYRILESRARKVDE